MRLLSSDGRLVNTILETQYTACQVTSNGPRTLDPCHVKGLSPTVKGFPSSSQQAQVTSCL